MKSNSGYSYAILAYVAWGFFPIYWKFIKHVPSLEILVQRIVWSWLFYTLLRLYFEKRWSWGFEIDFQKLQKLFLSSLLLSANWFLYIYAVNSGHIVESSLGYFINPIINILLGVFVLKEKLDNKRWTAVALACVGVSVLTYEAGGLPWISLTLAVTFGLYGLIRKQLSIASYAGGQVESLLMILPGLVALHYLHKPLSVDYFQSYGLYEWLFFVGAGPVTGLPLVWFAEAAKRLPLNVMGLFQYLAPTLQFLTGVLLFNEQVSAIKWVGFLFIWSGLAYLAGASLQSRRNARAKLQ